MATVLDITSKLKQEEKFLKIGDVQLRVDDSKNTVISALAELESDKARSDVENTDLALAWLLGEEGKKKLDEMALNLSDYKEVFTAVMSLVSDVSLEEMEQRFPGEASQ